MKTKDRQIGWHLFLVVVVFLLLMPIVFAISNSFKTMQEAFNTVFQVIPLHPTLENYRHVFDKLPFVKITLNTFLIASTVTIFKTITGLLAASARSHLGRRTAAAGGCAGNFPAAPGNAWNPAGTH